MRWVLQTKSIFNAGEMMQMRNNILHWHGIEPMTYPAMCGNKNVVTTTPFRFTMTILFKH